MTEEKTSYLKNDFVLILKKLKGDEIGKWGKMNAQQMAEKWQNIYQLFLKSLPKQFIFLLQHR